MNVQKMDTREYCKKNNITGPLADAIIDWGRGLTEAGQISSFYGISNDMLVSHVLNAEEKGIKLYTDTDILPY